MKSAVNIFLGKVNLEGKKKFMNKLDKLFNILQYEIKSYSEKGCNLDRQKEAHITWGCNYEQKFQRRS